MTLTLWRIVALATVGLWLLWSWRYGGPRAIIGGLFSLVIGLVVMKAVAHRRRRQG